MANIEFVTASRQRILPTIAITGPTGSGKTPFALTLATGFTNNPGEEVFLIDAESGASSMYAGGHPFWFKQLVMENHHPHLYMEAMDQALRQGARVIIIDSLSGPWEGGIGAVHDLQKQVVEQQKARYNGTGKVDTMAAWGIAKAPNTELMRHIRMFGNSGKAVVICTVRATIEYQEVTKEVGGRTKTVREAVGIAPVQDTKAMYEFMLKGNLTSDHHVRFDDSRDSPLAGHDYFKPGPELATLILDWINKDAQPLGEEKTLARLIAEIINLSKTEESKELGRRVTVELLHIAGLPVPETVGADQLLHIQETCAWLDSAIRAEYQMAKFQRRLPMNDTNLGMLLRRLSLRAPKDLITDESYRQDARSLPAAGKPEEAPAEVPKAWKSGKAAAEPPAQVEETEEEQDAPATVAQRPKWTSASIKDLLLTLGGPHKGVDGAEFIMLKNAVAQILGFKSTSPQLFSQISKSVALEAEAVLSHLHSVAEKGKEAGSLKEKKGLNVDGINKLIKQTAEVAAAAVHPSPVDGSGEPDWAMKMRENPSLADASLEELKEIRAQAQKDDEEGEL